MGNENYDVVQRYAELWMRGEFETMLNYYDDDIKLHYFGHNELAGDHVGRGAALEAISEFGRRTNRQLVRIIETMAGQTKGAIIAEELIGLGDSRIRAVRLLVYAICGGKFSECWIFDQDQALIDRLLATSSSDAIA